MSTQTGTKLTDEMRKKFPSTLDRECEQLQAGVYQFLGFEIVNDEKFNKRAYLVSSNGKTYTTTSHNVIGSLLTTIGDTLKEMWQTNGGKAIEVEIVPKMANTGRWGIAIKAF